ncbi:bacteriocin immunity protein, partial [Vibrio parahaemolyticus]|uniref:bacteriocin immunity protein n=2 Tax=Vibrionaceae TaxID=641 RepID=UPI0011237A97
DAVLHFEEMTGHPDGSDLIYYPENLEDGTPENIVKIVKEWRLSQGLPCFKD